MRNIICNKCGKEITGIRVESSLHAEGHLGYASKYDGEDYEIDLCPKCFEKLIASCEVSPVLAFDPNVDL